KKLILPEKVGPAVPRMGHNRMVPGWMAGDSNYNNSCPHSLKRRMLFCLLPNGLIRRFNGLRNNGLVVIRRNGARGVRTALISHNAGNGLDCNVTCDVPTGMSSHAVTQYPQLKVIIERKSILIHGPNQSDICQPDTDPLARSW